MTIRYRTFVLALSILFFQIGVIAIDFRESKRVMFVHQAARPEATTGDMFSKRARDREIPDLSKSSSLSIDVLSFTRLDPLTENIPACDGCSVITVGFRVTCRNSDGCRNLSVLDFYVTYQSAYPVFFYGDRSPNAVFQDKDYAGIVYGMQKEFSTTTLVVGEETSGELSFTVKPDASDFLLHYWDGSKAEDVSINVIEKTQ